MEYTSACTVYLIRHGETEWNKDGRWQGQTDVPLSAAGRQQSARLARRLAEEKAHFNALYSSDQSRALETAQILGGALGLSPAAAPELREIDMGAWSGRTRVEIARDFPEQWRRMEADEDIPRGGGETFAAFRGRVIGWLERAAARHAEETICVVTHGGCVRAILLHASGLGWADRRRIPPIENTSLTTLEISSVGWRILSANDVAHCAMKSAEEEQQLLFNEGEIV